MHVLKRQLKCTYDKLPWEEMEFCLISFIDYNTGQFEKDLVHASVMKKSRLLKQLELFSKHLQNEMDLILKDTSGNITRLQTESHDVVISKVVEREPLFQELYDDYKEMRDFRSLEIISDHIHYALITNPKEENGCLVILRSLQVIGEHLKDTVESPNLSGATRERLLLSLSRNTREVITKLRDFLSHQSLDWSQTENIDITRIQNDLRKFGVVVTCLLSQSKARATEPI
ncbi:ankyrin repeat protein [Caerostris extrusa]|uniref:Ankyrin repeat protein n=1 Tax=Caerostris extrusa TaxID=172846 RepID=A0AAV4MQ60_CAEEX|nr:ankyrin repeat protein [Caerostris extrusa]